MNILLANALPCCYMSLDDWQLIKITGADAKTYLQGQLTIDINKLTDHSYLFGAHCDPKGKVLSNMLIFQQESALFYIQRKSVASQQIADLKKYAIFSKINIEADTDKQILGLAGQHAEQTLADLGIPVPDIDSTVKTEKAVTVIRLADPEPRFIVITTIEKMAQLKTSLAMHPIAQTDEKQWLALDIEANYAIIDEANFMQFLPQAIGLEKIDAISFDKGCYRGQEMVARAQYRGANKRSLFQLIGESKTLPIIGDSVEIALGDNWRETGSVLAAVRLADNRILVQIVLNSDATSDEKYRIKQQPESQLTLKQ